MKRSHIAVAPNLHWRFTGVTATIVATVPHQAREIGIVATGSMMPASVPQVGFLNILLGGWRRPTDYPTRIWHARRNNEMLVGLFLRHVLRQPWTLVFTSAAQRRHTAFTRWLIASMDGVIATTPAAADCLERPARVISHGVDHSTFRPTPRADAPPESDEAAPIVVGAFGRVRPQKGSDLFVAAMIRLMPKYPRARAVICGRVTHRNARFCRDLRKQIADAGLSDRFTFLGELPRDEVPGWFARLDLFVAPMRREGFGLTPLEAMASGVAVVATRTGAADLTLHDGVTGLLVPPDDLERLTQAMDDLLAAPDMRIKFGQAGRERTSRHFDIRKEASQLNAFYLELLETEAVRRMKHNRQPA